MNKKSLFNIASTKAQEFWLGHTIVLLATILAVYLAASAGLKQAIQFELIKSNMDRYHLQKSMLDELNDNISYMKFIGDEYLNGKSAKYTNQKDQHSIDTFVWEAMKFAPQTFEIPSELLTPIRRYYRQCNLTIDKMTQRQSTVMTRNLIKQTLQEGEKLKKDLLPQIEKNLLELQKQLQKSDIDL
jgi:hypothetical protein